MGERLRKHPELQTKASMREHYTLLLAALSSSTEGIAVVDADGRLLFENDAAKAILANTQLNTTNIHLLPSTTNFRSLDEQPIPLEKMPLIQALNGMVVKDLRFMTQRPNGKDVFINATASIVTGTNGEIIGAIGVYQDITEAVTTQTEQEQSWQQLVEIDKQRSTLSYEESQRVGQQKLRIAKMNRLIDYSTQIIRARSIEDLLEIVANGARELTEATFALTTYEFTGQRFNIEMFSTEDGTALLQPEQITAFESGLLQDIILRHETIRLDKAELCQDSSRYNVSPKHPLNNFLGTPLIGVDVELDGLVAVANKVQGEFNIEDEALLRQLAAVASLSLQHILAEEELKATSEQLQKIQNITDAALMTLDLNDLLFELLRRVQIALDVDNTMVSVFNSDDLRLHAKACSGYSEDFVGKVAFPIGEGVMGSIFTSGQPIIIDDLSKNDAIYSECLLQNTSIMGVPLRVNDKTIGVLHVGTRHHRQFGPSDLHLLGLVANRIALAMERSRLYQVEQDAHIQAQRQADELNAMINAVASGLIIYRKSGDLLSMNTQAETMFGTFKEEYANMTLAERLQLAHPETPDGQAMALEQLPLVRALTGEIVSGTHIVFLKLGGQRIHLLVAAGPIRDIEGEVVGVVEGISDITPFIELQQLQQEVMSVVAHDIRQPLTAILGLSQMAERGLDAGKIELTRKSIEGVSASARRMNAMIQDLVDSVRLDAGKLDLNLESIELNRFFSEVLQRNAVTMDIEKINISIDPELPPIRGDSDRLERIVLNLLSNAIKYSMPGQAVEVDAIRKGYQVVISITDHGQGIAPEDLPLTFERFHKFKGSRKKESVGLGLYISRILVEAHGGTIWAESEPNHGSTFSFTLPLA